MRRSAAVATMTSESARHFVFDGDCAPADLLQYNTVTDVTTVDAATMRAALLAGGANGALASADWVANHYRYVRVGLGV